MQCPIVFRYNVVNDFLFIKRRQVEGLAGIFFILYFIHGPVDFIEFPKRIKLPYNLNGRTGNSNKYM